MLTENVHVTCKNSRAWGGYTCYEMRKPDFCEMCEEITNFMAKKRNAVMEPMNEN